MANSFSVPGTATQIACARPIVDREDELRETLRCFAWCHCAPARSRVVAPRDLTRRRMVRGGELSRQRATSPRCPPSTFPSVPTRSGRSGTTAPSTARRAGFARISRAARRPSADSARNPHVRDERTWNAYQTTHRDLTSHRVPRSRSAVISVGSGVADLKSRRRHTTAIGYVASLIGTSCPYSS